MAVDCNCELEPGKGVSKDKKCTAVNSAPAARGQPGRLSMQGTRVAPEAELTRWRDRELTASCVAFGNRHPLAS
jgi:hypothetical protein